MSVRSPSAGGYHANSKMASDIGPRKTMLVLVIVVGCFAVLWPKVFYPILIGSVNQYTKPNAKDRAAGCCDVFSETDINTIKIMSELCSNMIQPSDDDDEPLTGKEIVSRCKAEVLQTCGIDISAVLQEQIRLGRSIKQILSEVRSLNGSLCLKYHFGIAGWQLGVPHRITVNFSTNVRQERPPHLREATHPAFRERGSAIPRPPNAPPRSGAKIIEGKPGPLPGMRPPMGAGGHVPHSQKSTSSMSVIMPVYTVGIVIFFTYTLMKLVFKKQPDGVGGSLYPPMDPDPRFRKEVFESELCRLSKKASSKLVGWKERDAIVNAMSALLDEVDEEYEARKRAGETANEARSTDHTLTNGAAVKVNEDEEQASVKILGMEMTASCEGGQKWSRPNDLVAVSPPAPVPQEPAQEIYLEGILPPQSQILVADSATEAQTVKNNASADPAVVLAGKMTLSVISLEAPQDNEIIAENKNGESHAEVNGDNDLADDDLIEESKYTTASSATAAENEISDEENTDDEKIDGEEIEIEEEEVDVIDNLNNAHPELNHLPELPKDPEE